MKKRITTLLLAAVLMLGTFGVTLANIPALCEEGQTGSIDQAAGNAAEAKTQPTTTARTAWTEHAGRHVKSRLMEGGFYLNGQLIEGMYTQVINDVLYCSVRTFLENTLTQTNIYWANNQLEATGYAADGSLLALIAHPGNCYLTANGRYLYIADNVQFSDCQTIAPVNVLASLFPGSTVDWDQTADTVRVEVAGQLLASGADFYDAQDLNLISRIINCEAGNQPLIGKIAVGNVILNRVASSRFPNTVYGVLYARNQFTVVNYAAFQKEPNAESVLAAKLALDGAVILPNAYYYCRAGLSCWTSRNCPFVATIGDHSFYGQYGK